MTYKPNFTDLRIRKRIKKAIGFACGVMSKTKPHPWSTRYIDEYFGSSSRPLSKYLRQTLLICVNDHWDKDAGLCKTYILNQLGVDYLRDQLKISHKEVESIVKEVAEKDYDKELISGDFEYTDKSNRLWHPLQRYRRAVRTEILNDAGYEYHYDIVCAAPTLLYQYSQQIPEVIIDGQCRQGPMDLYLPSLIRYLSNRKEVRQQLANDLELDISAAKEIINALFAGARISQNHRSDIYHILNGDRARIEYLKQHEFISSLRRDIDIMWDYIKPTMMRRTKLTSKGKQRLVPINAKQKWNLYFELERSVIDSVRTYMKEKSVRYFLIHDGWTCDKEIDQKELILHIKNQTGFDLKLDFEKIKL